MYAPDCYNKLGTYAQMNPPIRDKSHYDRLWYGVRNNLMIPLVQIMLHI